MRIEAARGMILEHAVTGRARCRVCRKPIDKGSARIGVREDLMSDPRAWFHPACGAKADRLAVVELVERWGTEIPEAAALVKRARAEYAVRLPRPAELTEAVQQGDRDALATGLRALWWATRHPSVAALLTTLTEQDLAETPVPPKPTRGWLAGLDPANARQSGLRIVGASRQTKDPLKVSLDTSLKEPPDPRWVDVVLPWLDVPPYANAVGLWMRVLELLDRLADPRSLDAARSLAALPLATVSARFGRVAAEEIGRWAAVRSVHGFPQVTDPAHVLTPAHVEALASVEEALDRHGSARRRGERDRASLLHAAAAGDDGALLVYADLLAEAGDVRAEHIHLELAGSRRTTEQNARRKALRSDWHLLVGELGPVALREGLQLRRGLVVGLAAIPPRAGDLERVVQSIDWAGVERLELRADARGRIETSLAFAPHARRLRTLLVPDLRAFAEVLESDAVQPSVETIEVLDTTEWLRWRGRFPPDGSAFPALRTIYAVGAERRLAQDFPGLEVVRD
ncbi:MAG: hypothetical protein R3F61_20750 [Myxococcota bacterium]